jgi:hypothetical protein
MVKISLPFPDQCYRPEDRSCRTQVLVRERRSAIRVAKAADVVRLYMPPPENAIVICVDEKPSIQAWERAQGYRKLPSGRALSGHNHDYKRNGTTTLFPRSRSPTAR